MTRDAIAKTWFLELSVSDGSVHPTVVVELSERMMSSMNGSTPSIWRGSYGWVDVEIRGANRLKSG